MSILGRFKPNEKRELFYAGIIDNRGNIRLDRLRDAEDVIKNKDQKIRESYNQLLLAKSASSLIGIKINDCHIIAVFGLDIYIKCFDEIRQIDYDVVLNYLKNTKYVERV